MRYQSWHHYRHHQDAVMPEGMNQLLQESEAEVMPTDLDHLAQEAAIDGILHQGMEWRVKYQGVFWKARCPGAQVLLWPGDRVYVVGRQGNTLLIKPLIASALG
ncbi:hypothetical protein XM38_033120 [Halomicronema hongdechloris C2206]|uniref:NfeD-like C-terminal domain-containing protein n=1 Tax=Halomicronema hongdechloris C2206 TaxID=1641165 RepID=A0A1Z3HPY9_9CYAN|nr:NfeD family protein [Halomicronema hongdechloris]ASC72355.1 hypothetical protein XM38_033120 [Halomicronema hongdechloris C2206]